MNTLLHTCCAPCAIQCVKQLRAEDIEPTALWYNPNIHPTTEYKQRKNTLVDYARSIGLALEVQGEYGLRAFLDGIESYDRRCDFCYTSRLAFTAHYAAAHGFDSFSTTLLVSPYQNQERLREIGEEQAKIHGVSFLYRDFRPFFREGQDEARALELYMQKYCGCIFSEEDRYKKRKKKPKNTAET